MSWRHVYVLECEGFVKIGVTSNPRNRLSVAQTLSPFQMRLVGAFEGDAKDEADLHLRFTKYHHRGEWFRREGELDAWCSEIERTCADLNPIEHLRRFLKAERGRLVALAAEIGVTPGTISQWQRVPPERTLQVERATGIPRQLLCPHLFGSAA